MKVLSVLLQQLLYIMMIVAIVFFIWGIVIFFSSKYKRGKYFVTGTKAKKIGLIFIFVPVFLFCLYALLYLILDMGEFPLLIIEPLILDVLFIAGIFGINYYAHLSAEEKR